MINKFHLTVLTTLIFAGGPVLAQADSHPQWRLGVAYRIFFDLDVTFANAGSAAAGISSVTGRSYADGFVGMDSTGNALDFTTFWGYQNADQISGDSLLLRESQPGEFGRDDQVGGSGGFEITLKLEFGKQRSVRWGIEGGFGHARVKGNWSGMAGSEVLRIDAFSLGGIVPPLAPYTGSTVAGPGLPLLETKPTMVPVQMTAGYKADLFGFRFGPYFDFPITDDCSVTLGTGLSITIVDAKARFRETLAAPHGQIGRDKQNSGSEMVVGGYFNAQLNLALSQRIDIFTGVQYHAVQDAKQRVGDNIANLKMGSILGAVLGIQFSL